MSEWTVVSVLVTLVGLCAAIVRPLLSLKGVITRLTEIVNNLEENVSEITNKNSEAHGRIWEKIEEQNQQLRGHEVRLILLENGGKK